MMREINSGPTHGGGDYRAAYFGLGSAISPTVEVHWPNGVVENLGIVGVDQFIHLIEPTTPPTMTISITNTMATEETMLSWGDPAGCDVEVYRSTSPYFALANAQLLTTLTSGEAFYIDTGALATAINYYYTIRMDCAGLLSGKSAEKGVFHFGIVPGTP
jgi:hypothetical protein